MALIEVRGLSTVFGPQPVRALALARGGLDKAALLAQGNTLALLDVDLDVMSGEIFVVMGLSGSGKSTLVRHINRLIEPTAGQVCIDGRDVGALSAPALRTLRREQVSMVFQGFGLLAHRNVLDNTALGLELRGVGRREREAAARIVLSQVALAGYEAHLPGQLSGGMRQRVGLARALCAGTPIVLMDEPFSALAPPTRAQMQTELLQLQAEHGRTVVFITHDLEEALRLGDRVAILRDGRVLQVATPERLLTAPADAQVAEFVRGVSRARALRVTAALVPCPAGQPPPAVSVDATATLESVLPRLLGDAPTLGIVRAGALIGQICTEAVRRLLTPLP
jgi:glycine betaine/proline transport system ATP-binding protein